MTSWKITNEREKRLHEAANDDDTRELGELLERGDIDVNCRGALAEWTPLHTAASNGNIASMELLLNFKATLEITDKFGCTPLFYAVKNSHKAAVQFLLEAKSSTKIKNRWGETAMDLADMDLLRGVLGGAADRIQPFEAISPRHLSLEEGR